MMLILVIFTNGFIRFSMNDILPISAGLLKKLSRLRSKKYRQQSGLFIAEGRNAYNEILNSSYKIHFLIATDVYLDKIAEIDNQNPSLKNCRKYSVTTEQLKYLSDTVTPQGIVIIAGREDHRDTLLQSKPDKMIYLEDVREPGNLAAAIRNAAWFGFGGLLLSQGCVDIYSPKVVRGSVGAIFKIPHWEGFDIDTDGESFTSHTWIAADVHGKNTINHFEKPQKVILCFGNEAAGISDGLRKYVHSSVRIPSLSPAIDSLNLAVATGVFMYEMIRDEVK